MVFDFIIASNKINMKYFLSDLILEENETQESIKNKIASRLSIPPSSFRYEILLKKSIYSSSKLKTRVDLSIETNEFIKDTSLSFIFESEPFSFKKGKTRNRPIIYGATLSGLYAGLYLARCGLEPIIIDPCSDFSKYTFVDSPNDHLLFGGFLDFSYFSSIASFLKEDIPSRTGLNINNERYCYLTADKAFLLAVSLEKEILSLGGEFYFSSTIKNVKSLFGNLKGVEVKTPDCVLSIRCDCLFASLPLEPFFKEAELDTYLGLCFQNKVREVKNALYGNYRIQNKPLFIKHTDKYELDDWIDLFPVPSSFHCYSDYRGYRNLALKVKEENNLGYYSGVLLKKLEKVDLGTSKDNKGFIYSLLSSTYRDGSPLLPCSTLNEFLQKEEPFKMGPLKGDFDSGLYLSSLSSVLSDSLLNSFSKKLYEHLRNYSFFYSTNSIVSGFMIYQKIKSNIVNESNELPKCKGLYSLINENSRPMDVFSACFNGLKIPFDYLDKQD